MDVRAYTFTHGVALVEDDATAGDQPPELVDAGAPDAADVAAARALYVASQEAAEALGGALARAGSASVRIQVAIDAAQGTIGVEVI